MKSRVLIVDDSPTSLLALRRLLSTDPNLEVVGEARTGAEALHLAKELQPDLVTMDVYLGGNDGVDVARSILTSVSTRVVMVTGLDPSRADLAFRALSVGALDVLGKPSACDDEPGRHQCRRFLAAIVAFSRVKIVTRRPLQASEARPAQGTVTGEPLLALGASTGGPAVLHRILSALPRPYPVPIVIVQHIETGHVQAFADWLGTSGHDTRVASLAVEPQPGVVYVAPGDRHLRYTASNLIAPTHGEARGFQLPSIDEFFESLARVDARRIFAAILTGMGDDGAEGLKRLRDAGALTAVQSEDSCVVPGMPSAALRSGGATLQLTPEEIAATADRFFAGKSRKKEGAYS